MPILIDGYNLLHVTGVFSETVGPGSVEKLHAKFLDFLAALLDPDDVPQTTVVFDAKGRRATARRSTVRAGITVHYSARTEEADDVLAELVGDHPNPRRLVVVSSDHRVQRAARRRRATAVDSEVWYAQLLQRRRDRQQPASPPDSKPATPSSGADTAWWQTQFDPKLLQELADEISSQPEPVRSTKPKSKSRSTPIPSPESLPTNSDTPAPTAPPTTPDSAREPPFDDSFPADYLAEIQRDLDSNQVSKSLPKPRTKKPSRGKRR